MQIKAESPEHYIDQLPEERKQPMQQLRDVMKEHLPKGFEEVLNYGMIGYVVPHSIYPNGYHCDPKQPLPFVSIASQKNFIAVYHMGLYASEELMKWFKDNYPDDLKLDMGKSCIRFKKIDKIPFRLLGELAGKMSPQDWVQLYEEQIKR